jgi:hypothetical protein
LKGIAMLRGTVRWLGKEANNRAVTALLAIFTAFGVAIGAAITFVANRVLPTMSPSYSTAEFGEGYRRGRREAELEMRLSAAEQSIKIMRHTRAIEDKIRNMSDKELDEQLERLGDYRY